MITYRGVRGVPRCQRRFPAHLSPLFLESYNGICTFIPIHFVCKKISNEMLKYTLAWNMVTLPTAFPLSPSSPLSLSDLVSSSFFAGLQQVSWMRVLWYFEVLILLAFALYLSFDFLPPPLSLLLPRCQPKTWTGTSAHEQIVPKKVINTEGWEAEERRRKNGERRILR